MHTNTSTNLKAARTKKGLSELEISKALKIPLQTYINKENNIYEFTLNELITIINMVGGSIEELIS
jgi:DNA-binding XRE family transcriptional regulator